MILVRRLLVMAAFAVWQGGFIFYTAVVVPIGAEFLGSARRQGFITRQVTDSMNACGAVALGLMAWELARSRDAWRLRVRARVALWVLMTACAVGLFVLHPRMDALLDVSNETVSDRAAFRPLHRAYLWVSSGQWACAAVYLALTLAAWRGEDVRR
jgi:hypothetical protein